MSGLLIFSAACTTWGLGAALLVIVLDDHHPLTHLITALRHLGGHR
ncbi:hypothetical protein [Streptomyces clavifer]|nr:hypothetical protein OG388_26855 [Streptomyces clavifer]